MSLKALLARARPVAVPPVSPVLPVFTGGGRTRTLIVRRITQARALRLRVDPCGGVVRMTLPARTPLARALAWAESKRGWVEAQLAALPEAVAIAPGSTIPFGDTTLIVDWQAGTPRTVRRVGDRLVLGGPPEQVPARILRWLRAHALATLDAETRAIAAIAGVTIGRVAVGDPRSRWGSCSSGGDIRYSWRLILAPVAVRRATVAHEVAHRLHMDHGRAFHAAVTRLHGAEPAAELAWLRSHGAMLQGFGRAS